MPDPIDAVELARALIRHPSVTPRDEGVLGVLQETLEALGFTCHRLTFSEKGTPDVENLYARLGHQSPHFCFAGHTDVVPPGDLDAWTVDPFDAVIADGELIGRGANDMKGAIASFVSAAARFVGERSAEFGGSLSLLITNDEEGPSINGTSKVLEWIAGQSETIDACLVGEPTNPERLGEMVKIGRRGNLNARLTVYGTQGHTAYPHLADNPVPRLARMLTAITEEPIDEGSEHFQPTNLQVTSVDIGNPAFNVIPSQAHAKLNLRFNDLQNAESLERWMRARLDRAAEVNEGRYELDIESVGDAFLTAPGPLSELVSDAVRRRCNRAPELSTTGGSSDARFIKDYCPVVEFGLVGQTMHQVDERTSVDDIRTLADIYKIILDKYFAVK